MNRHEFGPFDIETQVEHVGRLKSGANVVGINELPDTYDKCDSDDDDDDDDEQAWWDDEDDDRLWSVSTTSKVFDSFHRLITKCATAYTSTHEDIRLCVVHRRKLCDCPDDDTQFLLLHAELLAMHYASRTLSLIPDEHVMSNRLQLFKQSLERVVRAAFANNRLSATLTRETMTWRGDHVLPNPYLQRGFNAEKLLADASPIQYVALSNTTYFVTLPVFWAFVMQYEILASHKSCLVESKCLSCGGIGFLRCNKCKVACYCDRGCAKKDWKRHKKHCPVFATLIPINGSAGPGV